MNRDELVETLNAWALAAGASAGAPAGGRDRLISEALQHPRQMEVPAAAPDVYRLAVERLAATLPELDGSWERIAEPYKWSVHGLLAHLLVSERYLGSFLGREVATLDGDPAKHLHLGSMVIAAELANAPAATAAAWRAEAAANVAALAVAGGELLDTTITFHGWPFDVRTALIARGFELWTHTDDMRRATGLDLVTPTPAELRAMSITSVASLPLIQPLVAPDVAVQPARVVLTGPGGGTFAPPDATAATIVVDVVDYCRFASRRITRGDLAVSIEGDSALAESLLAAATAFAL